MASPTKYFDINVDCKPIFEKHRCLVSCQFLSIEEDVGYCLKMLAFVGRNRISTINHRHKKMPVKRLAQSSNIEKTTIIHSTTFHSDDYDCLIESIILSKPKYFRV